MKNTGSHSFSRPTAGLWLAHKPLGETSFSVVKHFQERVAAAPGRPLKVMHGGALDPFATGLLPILIGPATKLFEWLHDAPKQYRATIAWGTETDTGDLHGSETARGPTQQLTVERIAAALKTFEGWSMQVAPNTSNKRVDGERAYEKAHRGEAFDLEPSRVYLHSATCVEAAVIELTCRGGFYVRALVRDLGRALGVPAHLVALHRTAIGPWLDPGGEALRLEPSQTLPWLPMRVLSDDEWGRARRTVAIPTGEPRAPWAMPPGFPPPRPTVTGFHRGGLVALFDAHENGTLTLRTELHGLTPSLIAP